MIFLSVDILKSVNSTLCIKIDSQKRFETTEMNRKKILILQRLKNKGKFMKKLLAFLESLR